MGLTHREASEYAVSPLLCHRLQMATREASIDDVYAAAWAEEPGETLAELVVEPLYVLTIGETHVDIRAMKEALCTTK